MILALQAPGLHWIYVVSTLDDDINLWKTSLTKWGDDEKHTLHHHPSLPPALTNQLNIVKYSLDRDEKESVVNAA